MGANPMTPVTLVDPPKMPTNVFDKPQRAIIYQVNEDLERVDDPPPVECMFNPTDYTVTKSNTYQEKLSTEGNVPTSHFVSVGSQSLSLSLTFDSYEAGTDVTRLTRGLWKFMETKKVAKLKKGDKNVPFQVAFEWGSFRFVAFITKISQKFTLFTHEGIPVRAKVDVDFTQYTDLEDYPGTNPTSGGSSAEQTWKVVAGDRLDTIAAEVYRDATQWRRIAEHNRLSNPLALRPGQVLRIPIA
jgi:LysM repeat protein